MKPVSRFSLRRGALALLFALALPALACKAALGEWRPSETQPALPSSTISAPPTSTEVAGLATLALPLPTATLLPPTSLPTPLPPSSTPDPAAVARQMPVFEEIWNVVNAEYLYTDFNGLDWEAVHAEYHQRIEAGLSDEAFYQAMWEMIRSLGDEHSTYFSPEEAKARDAEFASDYNYVGIGVYTNVIRDKRRLAIVLIFPGSPAEAAGLKIHDSILAVDGQPVVNEDGTRNNILRGPEGTSIDLTVQSPGEEPRTLRVPRQRIAGALPVPYSVLTTPQGKRIGYILIPTFNDTTVDDQIGGALASMSAGGRLDGLILDNRQNGGGNSEILLNTLGYFVKGEVGAFVERENRTPLRVAANDIGGSQSVPLTVLVGENTASFGEIFAGILQDMGRARVIGTQTEGNVEVLSIYNFSDGSRAWIATSTFRPLIHPDLNWEKTGILPDQVVPSRWDEVTLELDPAVLAALQYFDQEK